MARGFLPGMNRDSIATYLPSKSSGRKRVGESKTEWTYCHSGIAPARVSTRYLRERKLNHVLDDDKSEEEARVCVLLSCFTF